MIKKMFGSINMTWTKVILFSIITAVYTALINQVPFLLDTSFRDIAISYEWWVLFAVFIMANCKSPIDSALKTFAFFVISQPLIYLIEVPFLGWSVFNYYLNWIIPTIATLPMAFLGWYLKQGKVWAYFVTLLPITCLLAIHAAEFFSVALYSFPNHLLSGIFCIFEIFLFLFVFYDSKKMRIIGSSINVVILGVIVAYILLNPFNYNVLLLSPGEDIKFDDTWKVVVVGSDLGDISIKYDEMIDDYTLEGNFKRAGETQFELVNSDSTIKYEYKLIVKSDTYSIEKVQ